MLPSMNGMDILTSNSEPAIAGPIILPKDIYELFIPEAKPCSRPAVREINVLTAGRINVVAVWKIVATTKIKKKPLMNIIHSVKIDATMRLYKITRISPKRLNILSSNKP